MAFTAIVVLLAAGNALLLPLALESSVSSHPLSQAVLAGERFGRERVA